MWTASPRSTARHGEGEIWTANVVAVTCRNVPTRPGGDGRVMRFDDEESRFSARMDDDLADARARFGDCRAGRVERRCGIGQDLAKSHRLLRFFAARDSDQRHNVSKWNLRFLGRLMRQLLTAGRCEFMMRMSTCLHLLSTFSLPQGSLLGKYIADICAKEKEVAACSFFHSIGIEQQS